MPLRFCMVTTFYPPYHFGGDAVFVHQLSTALASLGHHVEVIHCIDAYNLRGAKLSSEECAVHDRREAGDVVVHRLHSRLGALSPLITQQTGQPGLKRRALQSVLEQGFDVIHFHNISLIGGPGVLAMGNAPVKLYTTHEHWMICPMHVLWKNGRQACDRPQCIRCCLHSHTPPQLWRYTGLLDSSLRHIDAILAPSAFTAQRHRAGGISACPIHHLPTFATIPAVSAPRQPVSKRPRFVYLGRVTRSKGVHDLAATFEGLPQYDLTIAGDGELLQSLRARYRDCPNITFAGSVARDDVLPIYDSATALILPCQGPEVFPLVVLEAMARGVPAIVREAGGSAEAVASTGGGVVYHCAAELASIVQRMATDLPWRAAIAQCALDGYRNQYTLQTHLNRYFELIDMIRACKRIPAPAGQHA
jgi:glycosyltransferase involved in cell wall biosynthesis